MSVFERKEGPCPKCGGTGRFCVYKDFAETGGMRCNQCFSTGNSDGFSVVMWMRGCTFPEATSLVAEFLGVKPKEPSPGGKSGKKSTDPAKDLGSEDAYVKVTTVRAKEHMPVRGKSFKRWLARSFFVEYEKSPSSQAIHDALTVLEGKAQFSGDPQLNSGEFGTHVFLLPMPINDGRQHYVTLTRNAATNQTQLLPPELLRRVKLQFCLSQLFSKLLVGRAEFAVFRSLFLSTRSLHMATSKEIPGRFVPRCLVLSDRFREKAS